MISCAEIGRSSVTKIHLCHKKGSVADVRANAALEACPEKRCEGRRDVRIQTRGFKCLSISRQFWDSSSSTDAVDVGLLDTPLVHCKPNAISPYKVGGVLEHA